MQNACAGQVLIVLYVRLETWKLTVANLLQVHHVVGIQHIAPGNHTLYDFGRQAFERGHTAGVVERGHHAVGLKGVGE